MRVIAGKFKKANLFSVPGNTTRPTTDFTKEVIFSILGNCQQWRVLDLFAGSGSLGLEALSRGANFVEFVEFAQRSIVTIKKNIAKLDCSSSCRIHRKKVNSFLQHCEDKYDLILFDPPYNKNLVNQTLEKIVERNLLKENGIIVIEHDSKETIASNWTERLWKQKKNGRTTLSLLK